MIKSFSAEKGFGFVECPEIYGRFRRDAFIHKAQMRNLDVGEEIEFSIDTNKNGMPQARDIDRYRGPPSQHLADARRDIGTDGKAIGNGKGRKKQRRGKAKATPDSAPNDAPGATAEGASPTGEAAADPGGDVQAAPPGAAAEECLGSFDPPPLCEFAKDDTQASQVDEEADGRPDCDGEGDGEVADFEADSDGGAGEEAAFS